MPQAPLFSYSASELSALVSAREVSCLEVMDAHLDRIAELNPIHNAIVAQRDGETLRDEARAADQALARGEYRGWLHGLPHGVKDLADAAGMRTTFGSPLFADNVAESDSLHIGRIRAAGAIFVGKTNTPEFGLGSQSYNPVYGVTRNARDPALTAGGSSGGAAVALATGMLPSADGSDMMGSLRNPAAFNGIVGLRPSQGRVPSIPTDDAFYQQLAVNGPMGRTVEDVVRMLCTMAGPDPREALARQDALPPPEEFRALEPAGVRIGWLGDLDGHLPMETGVLDVCSEALAALEGAGCSVDAARADFDPTRLWRTWLTLRQFGITRYRALYDDPEKRALLKPELVWEIEQGRDLTASDVARAGAERNRWFGALLALFERFDVLALPSAQVFPFAAETHWPERIGHVSMDTYHRWMEVVIGGTLGGLPVVSLPAGRDDHGREMGIQFMGPPGQDRRVLEFALAYERVRPWPARPE